MVSGCGLFTPNLLFLTNKVISFAPLEQEVQMVKRFCMGLFFAMSLSFAINAVTVSDTVINSGAEGTINGTISHQSNSLINAAPEVRYSHGTLIINSYINEATVSLFTLDGRELFHTSLSAGVNRIGLPNSLAGTGKALVVSVRGKDIALEQTIISSR
jgi:hypothetical protein